MQDDSATLAGELEVWPPQHEFVRILESSGLRVQVGRYAVRVVDCEHFSFENFGGDRGDPGINADAESAEVLLRDAKSVSLALASADLRHRFEVYDANDHMVAYLHHRWPLKR